MFEKYPEDIPWDIKTGSEKSLQIQWMLIKGKDIYTFTKSRIDNKFVYIQKNKGKTIAYKEYKARFTFQRLFDEGYELAAVA